MRDGQAIAALNYAAAPEGSKYRRMVDAQIARQQRPVRPRRSRAQRVAKRIERVERAIAEASERGDAVEVARWSAYLTELTDWVAAESFS